MKPFNRFLSIFILPFVLIACQKYDPGRVITTSLTTDGQYALTAGEKHGLLLWDLLQRNYQVVAKNANPMSAYFAKDGKHFIWQDTNNKFHIMTNTGKEILSFTGKKSFSNVLTKDLHYLYMTDINWRFYRYDTKKKQWKKIYRGYLGDFGKQMNLTLNKNETLMLSSGFCGGRNDNVSLKSLKGMWDLDCVVLWNVATGKPIKKYADKLVSQTYATISPNGQYIIAGDGSAHLFVYSTETGRKLVYGDDIYSGKDVQINHTGDIGKDYRWDKDGIINVPSFYVNWDGSKGGSTAQAIRYITPTDYFLIAHGVSGLILYKGLTRKPSKYLPLGKMPWPSDADLSRDGSIDSSPTAHILVTGQAGFNGINVYQYAPKTETLYRVWTPIINPPKNIEPLSKDVPTLPSVKFEDLTKVKRVGW